jgi:hypothetical protein
MLGRSPGFGWQHAADLRRASKAAHEEIETLAIDRLASCQKMIERGPIGVSVTGL